MIRGSIDSLRRPYISVDAPGNHSVLLHIDTGLNRKLVVNRHALYRLGAENFTLDYKTYQPVQLADLSRTDAFVGLVRLIWFGQTEWIEALITTYVPRQPPRDKDPVGLIGTELLRDCRLMVDFPQGLVEIEG